MAQPVIRVRPVAPGDAAAWRAMRTALWPEEGEQYHPKEIAKFLSGAPSLALSVLVAEEDGELLGFAELSIRAYAEGCKTDRVGFLEGWYVMPEARRRGIGRALVVAAEDWARAQGCTEFASNALGGQRAEHRRPSRARIRRSGNRQMFPEEPWVEAEAHGPAKAGHYVLTMDDGRSTMDDGRWTLRQFSEHKALQDNTSPASRAPRDDRATASASPPRSPRRARPARRRG